MNVGPSVVVMLLPRGRCVATNIGPTRSGGVVRSAKDLAGHPKGAHTQSRGAGRRPGSLGWGTPSLLSGDSQVYLE